MHVLEINYNYHKLFAVSMLTYIQLEMGGIFRAVSKRIMLEDL